MSSEQHEQPFKVLGDKLKTVRQKLHESVAEVSGAVEIDEQALLQIEQGKERPSEDILMLLINHFGMQDDEAANLWQLAGYDDPHDGHDHAHDSGRGDQQGRAMVMIMAVDPRVIYSDGAQVTANSNGVILGFSQGVGTPHAITTAKVGMSREQAYSLLRTLERTLKASEPRQLPPSKKNKNNQGNSG
jgi:transcriptional regulator with XRE-family HTH domain